MLKYFGLTCVIGAGGCLAFTLYNMGVAAIHQFQEQVLALATAMGGLI